VEGDAYFFKLFINIFLKEDPQKKIIVLYKICKKFKTYLFVIFMILFNKKKKHY